MAEGRDRTHGRTRLLDEGSLILQHNRQVFACGTSTYYGFVPEALSLTVESVGCCSTFLSNDHDHIVALPFIYLYLPQA